MGKLLQYRASYSLQKNFFFLSRLQVVSTRVGGVPEVLPPDLITLATPTVQGRPVHACACNMHVATCRHG